jgi:phage gpG-like protein
MAFRIGIPQPLQRARRAKGVQIEFDTEFNTQPLKREINGVQRRARDFGPVFERIRDDLEQHWAKNFTSNGLPVGGWAPLDAQYGSWKAARFPGAPTLVQTGHLFNSLSSLRGNPNEIHPHRAVFGTDIEWAKFHQMGTSKMPKRQIIFEPHEAHIRWGQWAVDYMSEGRAALESSL